MQQRAPAEKHHYAYKRQPSNQVYISTFNPHMPSGHMTSIKQYHANPYAPATTYNSSVQTLEPSTSSSSTASTSQSTSSSPFANFNLASLTKYANVDEIKGLVDRFGGLDGILASVTKVQKVISTVGQIAPMAKVFTGLLGSNKGSSSEEKQEQSYVPARRRPVTKRNNVKARGRKVQMTKKRERTRRSQVYSNTQKQR